MPKVSPNNITSSHQDWSYDEQTGLPYSGAAVQTWIKEQFDNRAGDFYYDASNNRFLVFSDEEHRELYLSNPEENASFLLGTFDAPFNYSASITLVDTNSVNYIQYGSTGNYVKATFDVVNKTGASIGENVNVTITIRNGSAVSRLVRSVTYGNMLTINLDEYLNEGTNTVTIAAVGQNTLAATSIGLTYYSINLTLSDTFDISQHIYPTDNLNIAFNITGNGVKRLEWYIDGIKVTYDSQNDDVTASEASRTKTIPLSQYSLTNGRHNLQYRAYVETSDGSSFYSDTLFRDFIVDDGYLQDYLTVVAFDFPASYGIIDPFTEPIPLYGATQYLSKSISYAVNAPFGEDTMTIMLDQSSTTYDASNGYVYNYLIQSFSSGSSSLSFAFGTDLLQFNAIISETEYSDLEEVTNGLVFAMDKSDSTNASENRSSWSYGNYTGTLSGFSWTDRSGWTKDGLLIDDGASFVTNFAPFASEARVSGLTLEIEFETLRVTDDSTVICDLRSNGTGLLITASEASLSSQGGIKVSTKYKSGVPLRISFVVNPPTSIRFKNLLFIYIDGILAGAMNYPNSDSFISNALLQFSGSESASILLKQIRCYTRALSSSEILNNYILYRPSTTELVSIYDRNDILDNNNQPSYEKLAAVTPVIIITGDVEKLMNFTRSDKKTYVKMDKIEIINNLDPTRNLTLINASMRCQGTSSMDYPRKNFRFYLAKDGADTTVDGYTTRVYDYQGRELTGKDRVYSFKEGSIPVNCWCLKADYAESSSTHNTGVARLWNTVMKNAVINNVDSRHYILNSYPNSKTPCRTLAQHSAAANNYEYDVRTTVDGFPITLFYHRQESDALICLGKYNWNNDKSTESVYGFVDIPGFDNSHMECWEVINGDYPINMFTDLSTWSAGADNGGWQDNFESRYPDDAGDDSESTRAEGALKTVCTWVNSTKGAATISNGKVVVGDSSKMQKFSTEKWSHLDVYKVAAYYIYLMRFGGVDQTVKNAMFTTEDGIHWYYINYDNDTILGVRNDGLLKFGYDIDRQSTDPDNVNAYCYAGHDSVLWNNLEADTEFMSIVSIVDQALYDAGLTYTNVINMFNVEQSGKWSERLHNYDYTYKYLDVWLDNSNMQLEKLQGPRRTHREWWLSNRFAIYDAKNHTGQYLKSFVSIKPSTDGAASQGDIIKVTPAIDNQVFGWRLGTNGTVYSYDGTKGTPIDFDLYGANISYYIGGSLFFFNAVYMDKIDFSAISSHIQELSFADVNSDVTDSYLEDVIVSDTNSTVNTAMSGVSNLSNIKYLRKFQMCNCTGVPVLDLSSNGYLEEVDVRGCSALANVSFPVAAPITSVKLSSGIQNLQMKDLTDLNSLTIESNGPALTTINVSNCKPFTDSINWLYSWFTGKTNEFLENCNVTISGINWSNVNVEQLINLGKIGNITLKGIIQANLASDQETLVEQITALREIYGDHCFESSNDLWITGNTSYVALVGPSTVIEGETAQYSLVVVGVAGTTEYFIQNNSRSGVIINKLTGSLSTTLNNEADSTLTIMAQFTPSDPASSDYYVKTLPITILKETYPSDSDITISGDTLLNDSTNRTYSAVVANTENYTGMNHLTHQWSVGGDLTSYFYIASQPANELTCVMACSDSSFVVAGGTITLSFFNSLGTMVASQSIDIIAQSGNVAVSRLTNAPIMNAFWAAFGTNGTKTPGKLTNENYITKFQASEFDNADFGDGTAAGSIFYPYRTTITHFEEIQHFQGLTALPDKVFSGCTNLAGDLPLPNTITSFDLAIVAGLSKLKGTISGNGVLNITCGTNDIYLYVSKYSFPNCTSASFTKSPHWDDPGEWYLPKCTSFSGNGWSYYGHGISKLTLGCIPKILVQVSTILKGHYDLVLTKYATDTSNHADINISTNGIRSITVEDDVTDYEVIDGCLYHISGRNLILVPYNITSIMVPAGYNIAVGACILSTELTSVTLPSDCTTIGNFAFAKCTALTSITGTSALTTIGERAFQNCSALASFAFPSTLTSIGQSAFASSGLTSVNITNVNCNMPASCFESCTSLVTVTEGTKIHNAKCFQNCTALTSLNMTNATSITGTIINGCSSLVYLHLPITATSFGSGWGDGASKLLTVGPTNGGYNLEYDYTTSFPASSLALAQMTEITFPSTVSTLPNYFIHTKGRKITKIYCYAQTAPGTSNYTFTNVGDDTKASGTNELHVPVGATGYTSGQWANLVNNKGFTLIYDL